MIVRTLLIAMALALPMAVHGEECTNMMDEIDVRIDSVADEEKRFAIEELLAEAETSLNENDMEACETTLKRALALLDAG